MHMKKIFGIFAAAIILTLTSSFQGHAGQLKGVDLPDYIDIGNTRLVLNGMGLRQATAFKVNVYVAGLYIAEKSSDPEMILRSPSPKRLVLHFLRHVGSEDLTMAWDEGFEKNVPDKIPALKDRIEKIKGFTKDMRTGQKLTFTSLPGTGIQVDIDGAPVGTVGGDDFSKAFLAIWLGPNPPNQSLKDGLLNKE